MYESNKSDNYEAWAENTDKVIEPTLADEIVELKANIVCSDPDANLEWQ